MYLRKLNVELPYDPTVPLLDIYVDKTFIQKDTCTPVFIAALFTIVKILKQPRCPSTGEQIKMWYICTIKYYSAIKKNKIMPFAATWMELEILVLSEVSQKEKDKYHMLSFTYEIYGTNEPIYRKEKNSWTWRRDLWLPRGRGGSEMNWKSGIS